jgi:hypothetical protein
MLLYTSFTEIMELLLRFLLVLFLLAILAIGLFTRVIAQNQRRPFVILPEEGENLLLYTGLILSAVAIALLFYYLLFYP